MNHSHEVVITALDEARIRARLKRATAEAAERLLDELDAALIVPDDQLPDNVVSMGSRVRFRDLDTGHALDCELVYPEDADPARRRVSVLAPVGAALIGLAEGETIEWPMPGGHHRRLEVISVQQPSPKRDVTGG